MAAGRVTPLLLVLGLLAGCSDGGAVREDAPPSPLIVTEVAGIPVRAGTTKGPGTPLADGLEVAKGSVLLGTVFPVSYEGGDAWQAVLLVTDEAGTVMRRYMRQANDAGLASFPGGAGSCKDDELRYYRCAASFTAGSAGSGRGFSAELYRREAKGTEPAVSHLLLTGRNAGTSATSTSMFFTPTGLERSAPLPRRWTPPAGPGELLGAGFGREPLTVEPGSLLIAPPGLNRQWGAYVAVVRITGDPDRVIDAYADQLAVKVSDEVIPRSRRNDGTRILTVSASVAGGDYWTLTAVERDGEPTYLLVEILHD